MNKGKPEGALSIHDEMRTHVSTDIAAWYLMRKPQTLRIWACCPGRGPIKPIRIEGRLAWSVDEIRKLTGVAK